jgi:hypothetical protein
MNQSNFSKTYLRRPKLWTFTSMTVLHFGMLLNGVRYCNNYFSMLIWLSISFGCMVSIVYLVELNWVWKKRMADISSVTSSPCSVLHCATVCDCVNSRFKAFSVSVADRPKTKTGLGPGPAGGVLYSWLSRLILLCHLFPTNRHNSHYRIAPRTPVGENDPRGNSK